MPPKSERFELRLDPETLDRVDAWRTGQDDTPSRAEAIRRLVDQGLEGDNREGFRLNNTDRLTIWMLARIMRKQIEVGGKGRKDDDLETVDVIEEAIYGGHFWALLWEMTGVMHGHVDDPKKVRLVVDILDMWTFIERAFRQLSEANKAVLAKSLGHSYAPQFMGFDGNNETEYLGIASFLVNKLDRFQDLKGRDFNSHMPTVQRYAAMTRLFEPMRVDLIGRELGLKELTALLKHD